MENIYLIFIYAFFFIGTTIFSFLLNSIFLKFAKTLGIRNGSDTVIRWGSSKPAIGGISFYLIFLLSIVSYFIFFNHYRYELSKQLLGLFGASTIAFLMGLADDAYNTKPFLKFSTQLICSFTLISTGTFISISSNEYINYGLTIFWVVGMMNSINMLDNMDAITSTVSVSVILATLVILCLNEDYTNIHIIILIGMLSSLIGFLYFNWYPSKLYMGDTGSQFLGIILAGIGIIYFWNTTEPDGASIQSKQLIVILLTFILPIIDTTTVVINRLSRGNSPFVGGKDHTTHHLSYLGLTDRQVAIVFAILSFLSILFTIFIIKFIKNWTFLHVALFGSYFLLLFVFLFSITKIKKKRSNAK